MTSFSRKTARAGGGKSPQPGDNGWADQWCSTTVDAVLVVCRRVSAGHSTFEGARPGMAWDSITCAFSMRSVRGHEQDVRSISVAAISRDQYCDLDPTTMNVHLPGGALTSSRKVRQAAAISVHRPLSGTAVVSPPRWSTVRTGVVIAMTSKITASERPGTSAGWLINSANRAETLITP